MWELQWLIERLSWPDMVDIFLVALLFSAIFYALRGTRAVPLLRGITALLITLALLSRIVRLQALSWLVAQVLPVMLFALPVIFQPELRRALERLGRGSFLRRSASSSNTPDTMLRATVAAVRYMAERNIGALIVFERGTGLQEYIETGVVLDAEITTELLTTIFDHHTVLHDGAVIVRDRRIAAAACVMPLTSAFLSDRQLGLRHRAAIGITEDSDAIALVVSEERGTISIAHDGRIIRDLEIERLEAILSTFFSQKFAPPSVRRRWRRSGSAAITPEQNRSR